MTHAWLDQWLRGTTCHKDRVKREVLFENETHIVLKHAAHSEYLGRMSGSKNCGAYARLYEKKVFDAHVDHYGSSFAPHLKEWTGRIDRYKVWGDCAALGVAFP